MKIKVGEKIPSSELFYLGQDNSVKKIDILGISILYTVPGTYLPIITAATAPPAAPATAPTEYFVLLSDEGASPSFALS